MNLPNGSYTMRLHMGDGQRKARVSILGLGKDGKPRELQSHWSPPEWTTAEFGIEVAGGKAGWASTIPPTRPGTGRCGRSRC